MDAIKVKLIGLSRGGGGNLQPDKTATPTKQEQTVRADPGYDGLRQVTVEAIPDAYQDVSFVDNEASDIRVGKTGVSATGERLDGQMLPRKPEQTKSVTPTKSSQLVEPDAGYALSAVEVDAIPDEYANISRVTADANKVKAGYVFVNSEGVETQGTNTDDADTSDGTMNASQLEADAVGYSRGQRIVGTMPIRTTDVEIDSLTPVPIPAGSYDGTVKARLSSAAAASVDPAVIKKDEVILGQVGTYEGADTLASRTDGTITSYTNDSITNIESYAFAECAALESVSFANVLRIEAYAFYKCSSLNSVIMPRLAYINGSYGFSSATSLRNISLPSLTRMDGYAFTASGIQSVSFPELTTFRFTQQFWRCPNLETIVLPKATSLNNSSCRECPNLTLVDLGDCASFGTDVFLNSTLFGTLILRKDAICALSNTNAFNGTKFASGGTGGTIYIPESLYNHLGDGTALDYKAATNWSVIDAYGTITWAKIEGSQYEVTT